MNKYLDRLTPNLVKTVCLNLNLNSLLVKRHFMFRHPEPSFEPLCLPLLSLHLSRLVSGLGF